MKLHKYESEWVSRIRASKAKRVLIVGPTGCGKTVVAVHLMKEAVKNGKRVLFLAHRVELINQTKQRLVEHGAKASIVGTIRSGEQENRAAPVQVASVQTLARRKLPRADIVFIDEAHRAAADTYKGILAQYPRAKVFGLTATPYRTDGKPLGDLFDCIVESAKPSELIAGGWLCRPRVWTVPTGDRPELSGVKLTGGDYNIGELETATRRKGLVGNIVDHWKRLAEGRPTVCYAVSVKHGESIRRAFVRAKIKTELITGETADDARASALGGLATGRVQVVVNCMVLTEGWDCPQARCAIVARPTMSQLLWFQMTGRVMRKSGIVPLVLDHAGNALVHPLPGTDIEHSLDSALLKPRKHGVTREKTCPECGSSLALATRVCSSCDYVFWTGEPPEEVLGELREIDPIVREREICELYEKGEKCSVIAKKYGCVVITVMEVIKRNGRTLRSASETRLGFVLDWKGAVSDYLGGSLSMTAIAKKHGCSKETIRVGLRRNGVKLQRSPLDEQSVVKAYVYGDSLRVIADRNGCGRRAIRSCLVRNGVDVRPSGDQVDFEWKEESVEDDYRSGKTSLEIAKRLGCSDNTVRRYLKHNGVKMRRPGRHKNKTALT